MTSLPRRSLVLGLPAAAAAANLIPSAKGQTPRTTPLDFSDPADNLRALMRIFGADDGTTLFWYATGRIYAVVPGRVAEPLFDGGAVQWLRYSPTDQGTYIQESGFVQLHYGPDRTVIAQTTNPVTGEPFDVPIMGSGEAMNNVEFTVYGSRRSAEIEGPSHLSDTPKVYDWKIDGDDVVLTYESFGTYKAPWMPVLATENSMRFYKTSLSALNDFSRAGVKATRFEVSETPFMPWLEMPPDQAGHMLWQFSASKHKTPKEIPAWLLADVKTHRPSFYDRFMAQAG